MWGDIELGSNMQNQKVNVKAAGHCLFFQHLTCAMGWGLSEGQWPQLAMEGPVMNVHRQSRTLQQNHHQFRSCITARLGVSVECVWSYLCKREYLRVLLCYKSLCVYVLNLFWRRGLTHDICLLAVGSS